MGHAICTKCHDFLPFPTLDIVLQVGVEGGELCAEQLLARRGHQKTYDLKALKFIDFKVLKFHNSKFDMNFNVFTHDVDDDSQLLVSKDVCNGNEQ